MALTIYAGLDTEEFTTAFSLAFTDAGGAHTSTIAAGTYCWETLATVYIVDGVGLYTSLTAAIQAGMNAVSSGYTVSLSSSTHLVTISRSAGFTSVDSGTNATARNMLGTGSNFPIAAIANAVTFSARPYYLFAGTLGAISDPTGDYQPESLTDDEEADDGWGAGLERSTPPLWSDFWLRAEPKEAAWKHLAAPGSPTPWTLQHFFDHVGIQHPFLVKDGTLNTVHEMRGDGRSFRAFSTHGNQNYVERVDVQFRTRVLGRQ